MHIQMMQAITRNTYPRQNIGITDKSKITINKEMGDSVETACYRIPKLIMQAK